MVSLFPQVERAYGIDCRTPQRALGLATLLCAGYLLFSILWPARWSLVATWVIIEGLYYVFYFKPRFADLEMQPRVHRPADMTADKGMKLFKRFLQFVKELPKGVDPDTYYGIWFRNAKLSDIKRGNAEEFMAYGFFYRSLDQMAADPTLKDLPAIMVRWLEEACPGLHFEEGYNEGLLFMGHLWEPLKATYRPLTFYLSTEAVGRLAQLLLRRWGFQQGTMDGLAYFTLNLEPVKVPSRANSASPKSSQLNLAAAAAAAASAASSSTKATVAAAIREAAATAASTASMVSPFMAMGLGSKPRGFSLSGGPLLAAGSAAKPPTGSGAGIPLGRTKSSPFESKALASLQADLQNPSAVHTDMKPEVDAALEYYQSLGVAGSPSAGSSFPRISSFAPAAAGGPGRERVSSSSGLGTRSSHRPNPLQVDGLRETLGSSDTPVLFLHGVGGLPAYLEMIHHVIGLGHPVILVEFRGVSMRWGKVYDADEVVKIIVKILDELNVKEVCLVGHSYGTFIAGALARHHKTRVHNVCLIDPVCFGMFMPHLLYNFLYRKPHLRTDDVVNYIKDSVRMVASTDMHVCATFSRGFYWSELNLWPEDLPAGSTVLLSGKDDLMNAQEVKDMLDVAGHVKVMYNHELTHGAFLLDAEVKATIVREVRTMLARSGSAVVHVARPLLERTMTLARTALAPFHLNLRHGSDGRGYVEDHTNRLVRTFTGNLATMLSVSHSQCFDGHSAISASAADPSGPKAGLTTLTNTQRPAVLRSPLLQTFSGPIRRKMARSWASVDGKAAGKQAAAPSPVVPSAPAGAAAGGPGRRGSRLSSGGTAKIGRSSGSRMSEIGEEAVEAVKGGQ